MFFLTKNGSLVQNLSHWCIIEDAQKSRETYLEK